MSCVLDASALLAYLLEEPGSAVVERALEGAAISSVNLAEVLTIAIRELGEPPPALRTRLASLGIETHDFTAGDSVVAAALWSMTRKQGLSLGDRACLALGMRLRARVLTAERQRDWRKLGIPGIDIEVIR
jgi:PIN domain nuclease of toxin-antitoxin system